MMQPEDYKAANWGGLWLEVLIDLEQQLSAFCNQSHGLGDKSDFDFLQFRLSLAALLENTLRFAIARMKRIGNGESDVHVANVT